MNTIPKQPLGSENLSQPDVSRQGMLTLDLSLTCNRTMFAAICSAIGSLESAAGWKPFDWLNGPRSVPCGQAPVPVSPTPSPESRKATPTPETSGRHSQGSSESANLQQSLASRLKARFGTGGSIEYAETWKLKATPLGRTYWAHIASGRLTSDKGFTGWQTVSVEDAGRQGSLAAWMEYKDNHKTCQCRLRNEVHTAGWPTPQVSDINASRSNDPQAYSQRWLARKECGSQLAHTAQALVGWPTPSSQGSAGETSEDLERVGNKWRNKKTGRILQTNLATDVKMLVHGAMSTSSNAETEKRGALNPAFSRWLMGFPVAWCQAAIRASRKFKRARKPE